MMESYTEKDIKSCRRRKFMVMELLKLSLHLTTNLSIKKELMLRQSILLGEKARTLRLQWRPKWSHRLRGKIQYLRHHLRYIAMDHKETIQLLLHNKFLTIAASSFWATMMLEKRVCGFATFSMIRREPVFRSNKHRIAMAIFLKRN